VTRRPTLDEMADAAAQASRVLDALLELQAAGLIQESDLTNALDRAIGLRDRLNSAQSAHLISVILRWQSALRRHRALPGEADAAARASVEAQQAIAAVKRREGCQR
jgi:hypothetical protein